MPKTLFSKGLEVHYKGMFGVVGFVSDQYITICVKTFADRMQDVCLVVYPDQFNHITLAKESTK